MSPTTGGPAPQDAPYGVPPQDRAPVPPPPGWYPDGSGGLRWWDGRAWSSATAPVRPPDRTWAVLCHLSFFVLPLIAAIALRLTVGRQQDEFTRHHTTEALNAQITWGVVWNVVGFAGFFSSFGMMTHPGPTTEIPWGFLVAWFGCAASFLVMLACGITGAVKASRGEWFRYPLSVRVVRGARRRPRRGQLPR
ncbi:DUF4870 domain-containing protein [Lapillicoccus jejuensis]|uniref:Uncharacterized protein n=1 Tax=Lapillicoccus jejuensis TaxID=402171 RepID=A0A542E1Q7_9MICO|nr:DUF4870 domain-containing protein [Lapillicoccus jejuensis]TQJ09272.1 hypothetical protein FB458_2382 [Lapillicoccus jejuensis]